jgi:hypothetical protein
LGSILSEIDVDDDESISKKEFVAIMSNSEAIKALQDIGVDPVVLVDFVDVIFTSHDGEGEASLTFPEFMDVVLQFRGSKNATVKDLMETQKAIKASICSLNTTFNRDMKIFRQSMRSDLDAIDMRNMSKGSRSNLDNGKHSRVSSKESLQSSQYTSACTPVYSSEEGHEDGDCSGQPTSDTTNVDRPSRAKRQEVTDDPLQPKAPVTAEISLTDAAVEKKDDTCFSVSTPAMDFGPHDAELDQMFSAAIGAAQRSVVQGHLTMQRLFNEQLRQLRQKEQEVVERVKRDGLATQLRDDNATLREENKQLHEILRRVQAQSQEMSENVGSPRLASPDMLNYGAPICKNGHTSITVTDELQFFVAPVLPGLLASASDARKLAIEQLHRRESLRSTATAGTFESQESYLGIERQESFWSTATPATVVIQVPTKRPAMAELVWQEPAPPEPHVPVHVRLPPLPVSPPPSLQAIDPN